MAIDKKKKKKDVTGDLGGIFGVASSGKKKKKKKPADESAVDAISVAISSVVDEDSSVDEGSIPLDEELAAQKAKKKKKKQKKKDKEKKKAKKKAKLEKEAKAEKTKTPKKVEKKKTESTSNKKAKDMGVEGILIPGGPKIDSSEYLNDGDLGDLELPKKSSSLPIIGGVLGLIAVFVIGIVATGNTENLMSVFKGNLKEKKLADKKMAEEEYLKAQKEALHLFGNMLISGHPKYSEIRLNGKKYYGRLTNGAWREVRIGTINGIQDLAVKTTHNIEVSLPGFETRKDSIVQGMWQAGSQNSFGYAYAANLTPSSEIAKSEFDARMAQDGENEFYGKVTITSTPAGADIRFNAQPLLDEKGEALKTPATFSKFYVKDTKTGKLVGNEIRVDSTIDRGHKIELGFEYGNKCPDVAPACGVSDGCCPSECSVATDSDCKTPKVVDALNREMWVCNWKDGAPPKEIAKGKSIQHYCDYTFVYNYDIDGLKSYIIERHKEKEAIKAEAKAFKEEQQRKRLEKLKK